MLATSLFSQARIGLLLTAATLASVHSLAASEPAPRRNQARFEVRFMEDMIDHHMMAVMTSGLCLDRAVHPELLSLCEEIMTSQMEEIEQMQTWLEDWYGITYEPQMTKKMQRQITALSRLDGAQFEIAFLEMMIEHHEGAIEEGRKCLRNAAHEDLRDMCEDIIAAQTMEIILMEMWLCDWYGQCE